jgi:hypothetical protein
MKLNNTAPGKGDSIRNKEERKKLGWGCHNFISSGVRRDVFKPSYG